jgi:hypothetical protein
VNEPHAETQTAPQPETPARVRNRWLAAFAVAACYGLAAFLVTGDSAKGAGLCLTVIVIFALLFLLLPRFIDTQRPLSAYYVAGLGVLFGPVVYLAAGLHHTPWHDLEARYPATGPAPAGLDGGSEVVLLQPVDEIMVRPHPYKRTTVSFTDDGVYLGPSWPLRLFYEPVWVPRGAIAECRPSHVDPIYSSLGVAGFTPRIEVLDAGEQVLEWCRRLAIDDGREESYGLR